MIQNKFFILLLCGMASILWSSTQWEDQGRFFSPASGSQLQMQSRPDGQGGAFLVWRSNASGDYDIFAQWIDKNGSKRWGENDLAVCQSAGDQTFPVLEADGTGGVIIAWWDNSGSEGNIYAQRINQSGVTQWPLNGLPVCTASGEQQLPQLAADGNNNVMIVWIDKRNNSSLYGQRIDYSGNTQWNISGIPLVTGTQSAHQLLPDGSGGAYLIYQDKRSNDFDIYAQRVNGAGTALWTGNGVPIAAVPDNQLTPRAVITSDNQIIVAWHDDNYDIYAQKISPDGQTAWAEGGIALTAEAAYQSNAVLCADDNGGAIVAWWDQRNGDFDIYAQKLARDGSPAWQDSGLPVIAHHGDQYAPLIVHDGSNGAFITWTDKRKGDDTDIDLYAQRIDENGALLWAVSGKSLADADNSQNSPTLVSDDSGGFLVFWEDLRDSTPQIYGQSLNDAIHLLSPQAGTVLAGGSQQLIEWETAGPELYSSYSISYSLTGNDDYPNTIATGIPASETTYAWPVPNSESTTIQIQIQGIYDDFSTGYVYHSAPFTIDASGPEAFDLISPTNNMNTSPTPTFQWEAAEDALTDIAGYELWIDDQLFKSGIAQTQYTVSNDERLASGSHSWYVKAINGVGLITHSSQTWNFIGSYDDIPPAVFHLLTPANDSWLRSDQIAFSWSASNDGVNELLKYQLFIDDELALDDIAPDATSCTLPTLPSGVHTWYLMAFDAVLNSRPSSETWTIHIDGHMPTAFDLIAPPNDTWTREAAPLFQWHAAYDVETDTLDYECWIDDVKLTTVTDTTWQLPLQHSLSDGLHRWEIRAIDRVLNSLRSTQTFQLFVDTQPPGSVNLTYPADNIYTKKASLKFKWQEAQDAGCGVQHYELWIDGEKTETLSGVESTAQPLTEGIHTWHVKAVDHLDQASQSDTFTLTVDRTPPKSFALLSPDEGFDFANTQPQFSWAASLDTLSGLAGYQLLIDDVLHTDNIPSDQTAITPTGGLTYGDHNWQIKAADKAGNTQLSESRSFIISNTPPVITSEDTLQLTEDIPFQYIARAEDPDGSAVTLTFHGLPDWFFQKGDTLSGKPGEGQGNITFGIHASDGVLSDTLSVIVLVTAVNDPPVITSPAAATATENKLFEYTGTATDAEGADVTITYENLPSWLSNAEGKLTGTPGSDAVSSRFNVIASDGELTARLEVQLNVIQINDPPVFTAGLPTISAASVDTLILNLDDYVDDPDHDKSMLSWDYEIINGAYVYIIMNYNKHQAIIYTAGITEEVHIRFTVSDPEDGMASAILIITPRTSNAVSLAGIPNTLIIHRPYPNPFNPSTVFSFGLPQSQTVQLSIFNLLGQLMETPLNEKHNPGQYEYQWIPHNLPSGVYIYTLQIGSHKKTGRLIYMQ